MVVRLSYLLDGLLRRLGERQGDVAQKDVRPFVRESFGRGFVGDRHGEQVLEQCF